MEKTTLMLLGAMAGYFLWKRKPVLGLALGGAAGYMLGTGKAAGSAVPTSEVLRGAGAPTPALSLTGGAQVQPFVPMTPGVTITA